MAWRYRESPFISRISLLQRLTHISASENQTTYERLLTWGSAVKGFREHPLKGWGFNNAFYALNKHYDPRHIHMSPFLQDVSETWFDKSHSAFLDLAVELGILGLIAYLTLLAIIARSLWRMPDRSLARCLSGAMIAYVVSNAVAFDSFGSLFGFYLTLAYIAAKSTVAPLESIEDPVCR